LFLNKQKSSLMKLKHQ